MGHLDVIKAMLLVATGCAWIALVLAMLGPARLRLGDDKACAIAFLITAGVTRLAFTEVYTRLQIALFCAAAGILVAKQASATLTGTKLRRWTSCAGGTIVGAIVSREVVHHYLWHWI